MSITISAAQRNALYDQILDRLSGIGDIELAIKLENFEAAERIGREYSDDLRLLLDDLGFGEDKDEPVELSTDPEVLRRILPRLRELATSYTDRLGPEIAETFDLTKRNSLVAEACDAVLAVLDNPASSTGSQCADDD